MTWDGTFSYLAPALQVFLIDLLLSGDNAVVIGLVCRSLPPRQMRRAMLFGTAAAILLRIYLTIVVSWLLEIPFLKLAGGAALLLIAIKLMAEEEGGERLPGAAAGGGEQEMWVAIVLIVIADLVMSLDNVIGLAAAAHGSIVILGLGLAVSIPLLIYGSLFVALLLKRYPLLVTGGAALLGWLGGDIAVSDPLIADWVNSQSPALSVAVPLLAALFVVMEGRIVNSDRRSMAPSDRSSGGADLLPALARLAGRRLTGRKAAPAEAALVAAYAPTGVEEALAAGALILLADDNPVDRSALRQALERLGYAVEAADDGQEAMTMISRRRYGLLLADYDMPKKSGLALAAEVRDQEKTTGGHLPIIGLIGYFSEDRVKNKCLEAGMDDCLTKSASETTLESIVRTWLPAAEALRRPLAAPQEG